MNTNGRVVVRPFDAKKLTLTVSLCFGCGDGSAGGASALMRCLWPSGLRAYTLASHNQGAIFNCPYHQADELRDK